MENAADTHSKDQYLPMATLELDAGLLKSEWGLCDRVAEYLSGIAGQHHSDAARYSNLLSVVINELVELAFKATSKVGTVTFELQKDSDIVRVKIGFACASDVCAAICRRIAAHSSEVEDPKELPEIANDVFRLIEFADVCQVELFARAETAERIAIIAAFLSREELP
jgi:hypothetical protein